MCIYYNPNSGDPTLRSALDKYENGDAADLEGEIHVILCICIRNYMHIYVHKYLYIYAYVYGYICVYICTYLCT
jgi:hypothetical protein